MFPEFSSNLRQFCKSSQSIDSGNDPVQRNQRMITRIQGRLLLACALLATVSAMAAAEESPAAVALQSIFSPQRAPTNKTMGLTQRSFIDLLQTSRPRLEIALVVDGTESMGSSLQGIRSA